jgi:hypothetical protein
MILLGFYECSEFRVQRYLCLALDERTLEKVTTADFRAAWAGAQQAALEYVNGKPLPFSLDLQVLFRLANVSADHLFQLFVCELSSCFVASFV